VAAGSSHTCAVRGDGAVECWGSNSSGQAPALRTPSAGVYKQVTAREAHTCATRNDGANDSAVECWGDNSSGQAPPSLAGEYKMVSAGGQHTCGLEAFESPLAQLPTQLKCWGDNTYGQAPSLRVPTAGGGDSFLTVGAGGTHTCAVNKALFVECWGNNAYGQAPAVRY
jgi:alpha-tubulin suppressor-like RCC1 family protein